MATISALNSSDDLDLSVLDSLKLNDEELDDQDQSPTNKQQKQKQEEEPLDLSSIDKIFPKEIQPLSSPSSKISSGFGKRKDPFGLGIKFHNGVDIPIALNTPINSLGKGTVIEIGNSGKKDYGKFVKVDYGGGLVLTYGHLNKIGVETGDRISSEAVVGLSGSTGRSTGPHLHIKAELNGKPVNPVDYFGSIHDVAIGALSTDDVVNDAKLDLSVLDNLNEKAIKDEEDKEPLDLSPVDQIGDFNIKDLKPLEDKPFVDRRTTEEKIAAGAASLSQPKVSGANPNQLTGDRITTVIPVKGVNRPDVNTITDYWLGAINPSYSQINQEYRAQTGRNLIQFDGSAEYVGNHNYKLSARMTKGGTDLINAYIEGRSKGGPEAGWEAAYLKSQQIKREEQAVKEQIVNAKKQNIEDLAKRHPYISSAINIISPSSVLVTNKEDVEAGIANAGLADAQLVHNLRMLPEALYKLYRYGGESKEYQDLIDKDREIQENLFGYQGEVKQPKDIGGKIIAGAATGVVSFPKYALAGQAGIGALPTLAYVENLHRGNIEAAKAALPMAIMVGATHGLDSFFNKGIDLYVTKEKNGIPYIERIEVSRGQGSIAPFAKIRSELSDVSLRQEATDAFIASEPVSIKSISPLTRQFIMRGTNAALSSGTTLLEGGSAQDIASNFVVGLTFPVGKYRTGSLEEGKFGLIPYVASPEKASPLQLEQGRVEISASLSDKGAGQTLYLNMDDAALHLLDLKRAIKEKKLGGANVKESLERQMAALSAINILDKQVPKEIQDYFEKNESLIRAGLKTNWEAVRAKEEYLGNRETTQEPVSSSQIKENPDVNLKETPIERLNNTISKVGSLKDNPIAVAEAAKNVFGNVGENNKWITPDRALFAFDRLTNTTSKGGVKLRSGLDLAVIGKDLVDGTKAIWDLTQISAFYLEDFYHRKVEANVNEFANKLRVGLGDIVKNFTDEDFQTLFQKGKEYLDSNVADPFFSKMKQDAVEKLPNRMTTEQARNVLLQHKDEFEWTAGLDEFLESNKDKKISKQDLFDIIQKGQVRVEESVADEREYDLQQKLKEISRQIDINIRNKEETGRLQLEYRKIDEEINNLRSEGIGNAKYSLRAYPHEKLELVGAKNSKEVKLISPLISAPDSIVPDKLSPIELSKYKSQFLYQSPHWDEPNVVAHYRANDRVSTDNKRIYFGEEFQSDWNHDIREKGLRADPNLNINNYEEKGYEIKQVPNRYSDEQSWVFGRKGQVDAEHFDDTVGVGKYTKHEAIDYFINNLKADKNNLVEPNPFMQHNWKELVLKRFLRDAAIAKKEYRIVSDKITIGENAGQEVYSVYDGDTLVRDPSNFNSFFKTQEEAQQFIKSLPQYKYDAVGWTTARQQQERYGGVLEGKYFTWKKNNDGTYTFSFGQEPALAGEEFAGHHFPHELDHISLERFAELTTKEAAQEVKDQETKQQAELETLTKQRNIIRGVPSTDNYELPIDVEVKNKSQFKGQFSLKEAVELRSGIGKYSDYDIAYKNILSKIGKRFGAKYSEKEITTGGNQKVGFWSLGKALDLMQAGEEVVGYNKETKIWEPIDKNTESYEPYNQFAKATDVKEKIHSLEITPSMRESLSKEGLPLYGTGGSEALKYAEVGVRNRIVTADAFNSAREDLVSKLNQPENKGITLNSGLNPDAFIDQIKLLYSGIKDLSEFTNKLVERYGEPIRQHAEDFYFAIKQQASDFKEKLSIPIERWSDSLKQDENSPAWQIREFIKDEEGAVKLPKFLRKDKIPELENYLKDPESHQKPIGLDYRAWLRGVALAQISDKFGSIYDTMRTLQRVVAGYETNSINQLLSARKIIKGGKDAAVAEAIYQGNESIDPATGEHKGKVWTDPELVSNFGLNSQQISAYKNIRAAIDNVLNLRLEGKLYAVREKATKLTAKLATVTPGSPEEIAIKTQLLDLADAQTKMISYYNDLKSSGYITLQRKGNIAVYLEDPSFPVGDPNRKIYNQFQSRNQAVKWIEKQKAALGIPKNTVAGRMYDIRNLKNIALKEQLTPSQFEDLVDRSGAHTNDAEIEKIRSEVYSKFPSFTYQLKRDFVRGYDRDLQTAINSTVNQLELYASSFYSKVGREEGLKALEATGIEKTDPNLYRIASSYIADETTASKLNWLSKAAITARRGTYLFQLGFDVNQLWMNAVAQPITQTYQYFYRIADPSGSGKQLTGLEPEHFFIKAAKETLNWRLGKSSTEFNDIVKRLVDEKVLSPEFTKTYIESQVGTGKTSKVEHWASVFMREGEKQTRLHAAAEGFFVGKEKFGLTGDDLINFIVKAVDATQSNPTRGENPFIIRQLGEGGKLFYQFGAFNQMWWENLALGVKQNKGITRKSLFLARDLVPLAIMGGISALPLSMFAGTMYTLVSGRDPKKDWDKFLGDDTLVEQLARYGISTSAAISRKISPQVPIVDTVLQTATSPTVDTLGDTLTENIPFFATAEQLRKGASQVAGGDYFKGIINLSPRALRGPLKVIQTSERGYKSGDDTILSRRKITPIQKVGQFMNIAPTETVEYYDKERTKVVKKSYKKLRKVLK